MFQKTYLATQSGDLSWGMDPSRELYKRYSIMLGVSPIKTGSNLIPLGNRFSSMNIFGVTWVTTFFLGFWLVADPRGGQAKVMNEHFHR